MDFILALIPILLILGLMIGFRWGAARSGGVGYLSALLIAILYFGAGPELLAVAQMKSLLLAIDVLMIIWGAFLLYRVADEAGAIHVIAQSLPHLTPEKGMQALIIGWVFAAFLQGVGGFGVPVAVIAPILVGLGFAPILAVVIPSIGHAWAVTFGSLGSSFNALLAATGLPAELLAPPAAFFFGIACLVTGFFVAHASGGFKAIRQLAAVVLSTGLFMAVVQYLVVTRGPWNLGAFIASIAGLLVIIPIAYQKTKKLQLDQTKLDIRGLIIALSGYVILVIVTLAIQLAPVVKAWLGQIVIEINFPQVSTSIGYLTQSGPGRRISVFGHTGMILLYTSLLAYQVYYFAGLYRSGSSKRIVSGTLQRVMSSSVSILSMVSMVVIMEHAGMTDALARGLAMGTGKFFPLVSPWIGAMGAFMTGSNTNSNVVFGALQLRTAELLGYSVAIILGAQTVGAAIGSIIAPTKVVVGASTAGMAGKEGDILRKLLGYTAILLCLISVMALLALWSPFTILE